MSKHTVTEKPMTAAPVTLEGYYREVLVVNRTNETLVLLDSKGNRQKIKALYNTCTQQRVIEISLREINGIRCRKGTTIETEIPGKSILVPLHVVKDEPYYVEELDMVLCTEDQLCYAVHPNAGVCYEEALDRVMNDICKNIDTLTVKVYGNDPEGLIREVWTHLYGATVKINLTAYQSSERVVKIVVMQGQVIVKQLTIPLDDILKSQGRIMTGDGAVYFIGPNKSYVDMAVKKYNKQNLTELSEDAIEECVQRGRDEITPLYEDAKRELAILKKSYDLDKKIKSTEIERLEYELAAAKTQINEWRGIVQTKTSHLELGAKTTRAEMSTKSEQMKMYGVMWKVFGASAIAALTWIVTKIATKGA